MRFTSSGLNNAAVTNSRRSDWDFHAQPFSHGHIAKALRGERGGAAADGVGGREGGVGQYKWGEKDWNKEKGNVSGRAPDLK